MSTNNHKENTGSSRSNCKEEKARNYSKKMNQTIINEIQQNIIRNLNRGKNTKITTNKKAIANAHHLITTLNINGLNFPVKRHELVEWVK